MGTTADDLVLSGSAIKIPYMEGGGLICHLLFCCSDQSRKWIIWSRWSLAVPVRSQYADSFIASLCSEVSSQGPALENLLFIDTGLGVLQFERVKSN
jgi:hypothetical protein